MIKELRKHNNLFIISLCSGNENGLGKVREKEMLDSGKNLGFQETIILNEPELQDGLKCFWD